MNIDDQQIGEAIDRIARTVDGSVLYLFLQKNLSSVPVDPLGDALQRLHGRRSFAAELMAMMATGIRESHGGRDPTDSPITFTVPERARVAGRIGSREFARLVEPGPGPSSDTGTE